MKQPLIVLLTLITALSISCSKNRETPVEIGNREGIYYLGNGDEPSDIDPHITTGMPEFQIQMALFEGLVSKDNKSLAPVPGVASRWDISEDLKTYTFHIREDAKWSDGKKLSAEDFVWSWMRALMPALGNQYAYSLFIIENAEAFHKGKVGFEEVGVKALDEHTLQVKLKTPASYFLQLLDHHSAYPTPRHVIEKFGKIDDRGTEWTRPENAVTNGAFKLKEWSPNKVLVVEKNPHYWDADVVSLKEVHYFPIQKQTTEERMFRAGQLHRTYDIPLEKVKSFKENNDPYFKNPPYYGTYFYRINIDFGPFKDKRVRQALAYSIDREKITEHVTAAGEVPSYSLNPHVDNFYNSKSQQVFDVEKAKALLAEAGYPNGEGFPTLELLYNTHESHKKIAVTVQQMWKQNLGINVTLFNQDWKVFLESQRNQTYQVARGSWIGDYLHPSTFLELFTSASGNNNTGWKNDEYDALVNKAALAATQEEQFAYFDQAEAILLEEAPVIPIYTYSRKFMLHPSVKGIGFNIMDYYPFKYISLEGESKN